MKTKVKCFFSALLILAMLLSGCVSVMPTEGTTEPPVTDAPVTEAPTTEATATEATEATMDEALADARRREYLPEDVLEFEDSLPDIASSGENAEQIRQKINECYGEQTDEDGSIKLNDRYTAQYWISGDILSVVLRAAYIEQIDASAGFGIASDYTVYTLHIGDGTKVKPEGILKLAGVSEEDFYQRVAVGTGNAFCVQMSDFLARVFSPDDPAAPAAAVPWFNDTIGEDYVHQAVPYLKDDGTLWFAGYVRQVAGASYFMVLLPYEQTEELSPYYEPMLELSPEFEGTT